MTEHTGPHIVILEDNPLILLDMQTCLEDLAFATVLSASTIEEASQWLERQPTAAALLDIDIRGAPSFQLAMRMYRARRPFAFLTGYADPPTMPPELRNAPVLHKPVQLEELERAVRLLLGLQTPSPKTKY